MNDAQGHPPQLLRGMRLKELRRYEDAERALKEALAQESDDGFALHQLAHCQNSLPARGGDALATIERALAIEPNNADHHALRAFILCGLCRGGEALVSARAARALDPSNSRAWMAEAQAHLHLAQWPLAETAARQALALEADHAFAADQLVRALRLQKKAETAAQLAGMLARDPENAYTHENAGWTALQRGEHHEAETHFREALRLDPNLWQAGAGLVQSVRARAPLYRAYLRYSSLIDLSGTRGLVLICLYCLVILANCLAGIYAFAALKPLVVLYRVLVLWIWVANGSGVFLSLRDSFAHGALRPWEKRVVLFGGCGVMLGGLLLVAGALWLGGAFLIGGCCLTAVAVLPTFTLDEHSPAGRAVFGIIGNTFVLLPPLLIAPVPVLSSKTGGAIFAGALLACGLYIWIGNLPSRKPLEQ